MKRDLGGRLSLRLPREIEQRVRRVAMRSDPQSTPGAVLRAIIDLDRLRELEERAGIDPAEPLDEQEE